MKILSAHDLLTYKVIPLELTVEPHQTKEL